MHFWLQLLNESVLHLAGADFVNNNVDFVLINPRPLRLINLGFGGLRINGGNPGYELVSCLVLI